MKEAHINDLYNHGIKSGKGKHHCSENNVIDTIKDIRQ